MKSAIFSIYKITNTINNKSYVGFTSQAVNKRWNNHISDSRKSSRAFPAAVRKYGKDNFVVETLYQSTEFSHTLDIMEEHFIRSHNTHIRGGQGYNLNYGGNGHYGLQHKAPMSLEHRNKIRQAHLGKSLSEEHKAKIAVGGTGRKHTPETITKMEQAIRSEDFKAARRAYRWNDEQYQKAKQRPRGMWTLQRPDGTVFKTNHINHTCLENGVKYLALHNAFKEGRGINRGPTKGWKLLSSL